MAVLLLRKIGEWGVFKKTTFLNPYIVAAKGIYTEKSEGFRRPLILERMESLLLCV